jgi:hypothetical protein
MWINDAEQDSNGDFIKDYRIEVRIAPEWFKFWLLCDFCYIGIVPPK